MDKNYIICPKDSYTQIEGIDREHLTQQYMFAQLGLMQQFTELLKIQGRKEMKNQNFYMRVISLLLVILAVLFYSSSMKAQANEKEIAALTDKVDTLQEQQNELLSALETSYVNRMQNQEAMTKQQILQTAMYPMQTQRTQQPQIPIMYIKMEPIQEKQRDTAGPFRWR